MWRNKQPKIYLVMMVMVIGLLLGLLWASPGWPTLQSQADLPPLDPPTPVPVVIRDDADDDTSLLAYIELFASSPAPAGAWSVVQWQDLQGDWHDVEGWRGRLEFGGYQRWTVEAKDFGTGPFRWQIRQGGPDGPVLGTSEPFTLPDEVYEAIQVTVSL
jgi:hypothetical protein